MKAQVLYFTKSGQAQLLAEAVSKETKFRCDQIPPAYPCEGLKLVLIGIDNAGKKAPKPLLDFCKDLNPKRVQNVAFFSLAGGSTDGIDELKSVIKAAGTAVVENAFVGEGKSSLFGGAKVVEQNLTDIKKWASTVVAALGE